MRYREVTEEVQKRSGRGRAAARPAGAALAMLPANKTQQQGHKTGWGSAPAGNGGPHRRGNLGPGAAWRWQLAVGGRAASQCVLCRLPAQRQGVPRPAALGGCSSVGHAAGSLCMRGSASGGGFGGLQSIMKYVSIVARCCRCHMKRACRAGQGGAGQGGQAGQHVYIRQRWGRAAERRASEQQTRLTQGRAGPGGGGHAQPLPNPHRFALPHPDHCPSQRSPTVRRPLRKKMSTSGKVLHWLRMARM